MKNKWIYKFFSAIVIVMLALAALPVTSAYAANCISNGDGNWTTITWTNCAGNPGGDPATGDTVTIRNGDDVVLNTDTTVTSITLGQGTSGSLTLGNSDTNRTLTITGDVTVNNGANFNTAGNGGNILNIGGNLTNNGTFDMNFGGDDDAEVFFNGTGAQTISGTGATLDFSDVTISNTSATVATTRNLTVGDGEMTVNNGATFNVGTFIISGGGEFTLAGGGVLWIGSTAGITTAGTATGNIQTTNRNFSAGAHYVYSGTANQNTGSGFPNNLTGSLTINNPGNTVTLSNGRTIANNGNLNLSAGTFAAGTNLTMATTSTINRSEGSITGTLQGNGRYNINYTGNSKTTGIELSVSGNATQGLNNVTMSLNAGQTLTLDQNGTADGNLTLTSGILDLNTFTLNRSAAGGTFSMAAGTSLLVGGTNNFPANYNTVTLNSSSTVNYDMGGNQTVSPRAYGNLILSASGSKSIAIGTSIVSNIEITSTAQANIGAGLSIPANSLSFNSIGQVSGSWGSTSSPATNTNNTFFTATTGILNVATNTSPFTPTTLTVSPASGTYGGTASLNATISPAVAGKTINFTLNGVSAGSAVTNASGIANIPAASLVGINAGTYLGGVGSGVGASFAGDSTHGASSGTNTLTVNRANATITVNPYNVTYDGSPHTSTGTATGVLGEDLSASLNLSGTTHTNAGTYTGDAWTFNGGTNYNSANGTVNNAIGRANATITVNPYSVTYDGSPHTSTGTATGVLGEDLSASLNLSGTTHTNAGTYTGDAWTFNGGTNYNSANGTVNNAIGRANATITVNPYSVTYDGLPHTSTGTVTGVLGESLTGLDLSATTHTNAGTYTSDAWTFTDSTGNYNNTNGTVNNVITVASATVTLSNLNHTYDGTAKSATVTTNPSGLSFSITYDSSPTAPTNAGSYAVVATITDPNYSGSANDTLVIAQASVTPSITANNKVYDGNASATFSCSLAVVIGLDDVTCTGAGNFDDKNVNTNKLVTVTGITLGGTDAGNYTLSSTSATDNADITQRDLNVTATGINKVYDGNTSATVTLNDDRVGGDSLTLSYTSASFADPNVNIGILVSVSGISISGGTDAGNYSLVNNTANTTADITILGQTITVLPSAPTSAPNGTSFNVAATASSALPVTITVSGGGICSIGDVDGSTTDGDATVTMTSGTGTCSVFYNQAGNSNYTAAPQVQEDVDATEGPVFTSANNSTFDFGFIDSFDIETTGNPNTSTITPDVLPAGVSLSTTVAGIATLSTDGTTPVGVYTIIFTADNGVAPNGTQSFTLTIRNGPVVAIVNSTPDTGNGNLNENENISTTLGVNQITVQFSSDVYDPAGDTDADDVTNPANYILVRSANGTFGTTSCLTGVGSPDVQISVNTVTYSNGDGSGPFVATLEINSGLPVNVEGFYRLFVCGTTSIVDATNPLLSLAGNGVTPGTDFTRNFRITAPVIGGGGGGGGGASSATTTPTLTGLFIPVTGFAPSQVTNLPAQPVDKEYAKSELTIKIPSLGVNLPIVGIKLDKNGWDVTWLGNNAGYLEGSAYPTWKGNSILTSHVTDPNGKPGPFAYINELRDGEKIYVHNNGFIYVYEVRASQLISPSSINSLFKHEEDAWITLVTCENYNEKTGTFTHRRVVRAVLISVIAEK